MRQITIILSDEGDIEVTCDPNINTLELHGLWRQLESISKLRGLETYRNRNAPPVTE